MYYFAPYKTPGGAGALLLQRKGLCVSLKSMEMNVKNTDSCFKST